jgi:hypothetical protein
MIESNKISTVLSTMNRETIEGSIKWTELVRVNDIGLNSNEKLSGKVYQAEYKGRAVVVFKCLVKIQTEEFEYNWVPEFKLIMLDNKGKIDWEFPRHRAISDLYESVRFKVSGTHIPNITSDGHRRYQQEQLDEYIGINKMRYDIIKTENYLLVVDDSEIKENDHVYYPEVDEIWCKKLVVGFNKGYKAVKIIAHLPLNGAPILDGVPVLPQLSNHREDKDYSLSAAKEFAKSHFENLYEKYPLGGRVAIKNIMNVLEVGVECGHKFGYKEALQQPKYPIAFNCEEEYDCCKRYLSCMSCDATPEMVNLRPRTIINSEGRDELVGRYIYE